MTAASSPRGETEERKKETRTPGQLILRMLRITLEHRGKCLMVVAMQGLLVGLNLATLGLTGVGIDYLKATLTQGAIIPSFPLGWSPPDGWSPFQVVLLLASAILVAALLTALLKYLAAIASAQLSQELLIQIRTAVYARLQQLNFRFYDRGASSSIINRAAGDANAVRNFVDGVVIRVLTVALTLTVYFIYMLRVHVELTLVCLATTPLLWIGAAIFSRRVQPAYREASDLGDVMIRTLVENLQGIQVVKGYARESEQAARFAEANQNIRSLKESIFFKISIFQPAMGLVTQINMLILIGYGGHLVIHGELAMGAGLFVFANLLHEFANQVGQITNIANSIQSSLASADRVFEVLDEPVGIEDKPDGVRITNPRGEIRFENISFGYSPDRPVLRNISFSIEPGECVAITGPTGSGKTTILMLMMRFYDVSSGRIRLDGHDIRDIRLFDLRRSLGIVFQESFLFSNTIAANIAFGRPDATKTDIEVAAAMASADGFIGELPDGYCSMLGEHGSNLSGGQRQRLALARAVLAQPGVLLLDDATASVDPETEHEIQDAMLKATGGRTTVMVSNRLSALRRADRIIVLKDGLVDAIGTHSELVDSCLYYQELCELQHAELQTLHATESEELSDRVPQLAAR